MKLKPKIPLGLFLLGMLSILSGSVQLSNLAAGAPEVIAEDAYTSATYFTHPIPIVTHIVFGSLMLLLGPLQFSPNLRRKNRRWHRMAGTIYMLSALLAGGSAIWMNAYFPEFGGPLKYWGVLASGVLIMASPLIALRAVISRDFATHRAWMIRAHAVALSPATQRVFLMPVFLANGGLSDTVIGLGIWFGLILNLAVGEWWVRRNQDKFGAALAGFA